MLRFLSIRPVACFLTLVVLSCANFAAAQDHVAESMHTGHAGRVLDSSTRHLLVSGGLTGTSILASRRDPRVLMRLADLAAREELAQGSRRRQLAAEGDLVPGRTPAVDWSVSLGAGNVAPNMFPAKFTFNLNTNPDCTKDYAVFALNVAGITGGQANLVGVNKLYSGTTPAGLCGATPNVNWAYNGTSTATGVVLTSPQLSPDGRRIAYVESTASSSIFQILTWKAGEGASATAAAAPTAMGSCTATSSCLVSLTYSNTSTTSLAPPWIDYESDKAYVASDDGNIYRLSCAFTCAPNTAPVIDWTFTLPVAGTGGVSPVPDGPVFDAATQLLIVGDQLGELWVLDDSGATPVLHAGPVMIGGGGCTITDPPGRTGTPAPCSANGGSFGIPDTPLLDVSTQRIFAFTGNDGTAGSSAALVQLSEDLTAAVRVHIGRGSVANITTNVDLHDGAFDDAYFGNTPTTGHLFMCGTAPNNTRPYHFWIGFANYPTMDNATAGTLQRRNVTGIPCTPYTEIFNPNLNLGGNVNHHDLLVSGLTSTGVNGLIVTNDISVGNITSNLRAVNYPGGISAIITDNTSAANQASSFYFSTLTNSTVGTCANTLCAVKLTQGTLR
jgi:hypothetical protein